jgi:hypothetical protein
MSHYRFPFHRSERESESRLKRAEGFLLEWVAVGNSEKNRKKLLSKIKRITLYSHEIAFLQPLIEVLRRSDARLLAVLLETLHPFTLEELETQQEPLLLSLHDAIQESLDPFRSAMVLEHLMHKNAKQNGTLHSWHAPCIYASSCVFLSSLFASSMQIR